MIYLNHICDPENNSSRWMKLNVRIFSKSKRGYPRAPLLGPLLFLLCINDLVNCTSVTSILLQMTLVLVLVLHVQLNWLMTSKPNWIQFITGWKLTNFVSTHKNQLHCQYRVNLTCKLIAVVFCTTMKRSVSANQRSTWEFRLIVTLISNPTYNSFTINSLAL